MVIFRSPSRAGAFRLFCLDAFLLMAGCLGRRIAVHWPLVFFW